MNCNANRTSRDSLLETGIGQERKKLPNGVRIDDVINIDVEARPILNKWTNYFAELFSKHSSLFDENHLNFF